MTILGAYEELMTRGGAPEHEAEVRARRSAFEKRTGAFGVDDPWFDARSKAFWDDALVRGFARLVQGEVSESSAAHVAAIERAHRGLFLAREIGGPILECAITGAAFPLTGAPLGEGFVQGWVAGAASPREIVLLPGAITHAPEATGAIESLLERAAALRLRKDDLLDALLRMDRTLQAMPRPKAQLAYRPEALR